MNKDTKNKMISFIKYINNNRHNKYNTEILFNGDNLHLELRKNKTLINDLYKVLSCMENSTSLTTILSLINISNIVEDFLENTTKSDSFLSMLNKSELNFIQDCIENYFLTVDIDQNLSNNLLKLYNIITVYINSF